MKAIFNIFVLIYLVIISSANSQIFWKNVNGKDAANNLTNQLSFENDPKTIEVGTVDPTASAVNANDGSIYINATAIYQKQDNGSTTNWLPLLIGPAGSGTDNHLSRWDGTGVPLLQDSLAVLDDLGALSGLTQLDVGNISMTANTISSTDVNGNITLDPNGTGKVVINSDLDVLGTVTNFSQTSLVVSNATISVNDGGTQATADSNDAGMIVKMTDATDTQIGYDSTVASKWIAGEIGSLAEVATVSHTQTLTNKTIDSSLNTITNIVDADIKAGANIARSKIASGTADRILINDGAGAMSESAALSNGQIMIGASLAAPIPANIGGTADQVLVANGANSITLSLPQSIALTSSPTFVGERLTGLAINSVVKTDASSNLTTGQVSLTGDISGVLPIANGGTNSSTALNNDRVMLSSGSAIVESGALINGQILVGSTGLAPAITTIGATANQTTVTNGAGTISVGTVQDIATTSSPSFTGLTLSGLTPNSIPYAGVGGLISQDNANFSYDGTTFLYPLGSLKEQAASPANPAATRKKTYCKTDGHCYSLDSSGVETQLDDVAYKPNLLTDGEFNVRVLTGSDGLTCTVGTCSQETATRYFGKGLKIALTAQTANVTKCYDNTDSQWDGQEIQIDAYLNTSLPDAYLCYWDGTTESDCVFYSEASKWTKMTTYHYVGTENSICYRVKTLANQTGNIFVDESRIYAIDVDGTTKVTTQEYRLSQAGSAMTDRFGELEYNLGTATITSSGASLVTISDDAAGTRTKFTANDDIYIAFHGSFTSAVANRTATIGINGAAKYDGGVGDVTSSVSPTAVTNEIKLLKGDFITFGLGNPIGETFDGANAISNTASLSIVSFVAKRFEQAQVLTQNSKFRIDANIGSANPSLGLVNVASYSPIEDASLELVINPKSYPAGIPCSGINENNVGDLTCAVGNESVGIIFNYNGEVKACASFAHFANVDAVGALESAFQLVKTGNADQIPIEFGNEKIDSSLDATNVTAIASGNTLRICGVFNSSGKTTLRLFYEQSVSGTVNSSVLIADRAASSGQRDIHWEVIPISNTIVGSFAPKKTQQKCLTADFLSTGVMTDLTFNNLTIGKYYEVTGAIQVGHDVATLNTKQSVVRIKNGATILRTIEARSADVTLYDILLNPDLTFKALNSTLTFEVITSLRTDIHFSSGSANQTCIELKESNLEETTIW